MRIVGVKIGTPRNRQVQPAGDTEVSRNILRSVRGMVALDRVDSPRGKVREPVVARDQSRMGDGSDATGFVDSGKHLVRPSREARHEGRLTAG